MPQFRRRPVSPMLGILHNLHVGRYRPDPVNTFEVEKADGGRRTITLYSVRDRLVQRACLLAVRAAGERLFLPCSYGFRAGLTVDMAVSRVREWVRSGYPWLVDGDIVKCFDRIPRRAVLRLLQALTGDEKFVALVRLWLPYGSAEDCGLPQGMVLSPFLCNLYLHGFDLAMRRAGVPTVRYADDFVLLTRGQREAQAARALAGERLAGLRLQLHPEKSKVLKSAPKYRFLGKRLPDAHLFARAA